MTDITCQLCIVQPNDVVELTQQIYATHCTINTILIEFDGTPPVVFHDIDGIDLTSELRHLEIEIPWLKPNVTSVGTRSNILVNYDTTALLDSTSNKDSAVMILKPSVTHPMQILPVQNNVIPRKFTARLLDSDGALTRLDGTVGTLAPVIVHMWFTFHNGTYM